VEANGIGFSILRFSCDFFKDLVEIKKKDKITVTVENHCPKLLQGAIFPVLKSWGGGAKHFEKVFFYFFEASLI
jgi:hypothetical protein